MALILKKQIKTNNKKTPSERALFGRFFYKKKDGSSDGFSVKKRAVFAHFQSFWSFKKG